MSIIHIDSGIEFLSVILTQAKYNRRIKRDARASWSLENGGWNE